MGGEVGVVGRPFPLGAIVPFGVVAALVASGMVVSTPWVGWLEYLPLRESLLWVLVVS